MSYLRVIPRDLFNEGNLLKCLGQLWLNLEKMRMESSVELTGEDFGVFQDMDGNLRSGNIEMFVRGRQWHLRRPLNARGSYPLFAYVCEYDEEVQVFTDNGDFTQEMINYLRGLPNADNQKDSDQGEETGNDPATPSSQV